MSCWGASGRRSKVRPAVVIASNTYLVERPDVLLGISTTNVPATIASTDYLLVDWLSAGLRALSCFRAYVLTMHRSELTVIGHLSDQDWNRVQVCVRDLKTLPVPERKGADHSKIGDTLASTSSMTAAGMLSSFLPPRAAKSRVRGWSQRTTPVVLVLAPVSGTAKPAVRAKLPPLVIGRTIGSFVIRLNASGDTINTGHRPFCSCPNVGSRLTSQISPRFIK